MLSKSQPAGAVRVSGLRNKVSPGTEVPQGSSSKGHSMDGDRGRDILCVACKALPRPQWLPHYCHSGLSSTVTYQRPLISSPKWPPHHSPHFSFFVALSLSDILLLVHCLSPIRMKAPQRQGLCLVTAG